MRIMNLSDWGIADLAPGAIVAERYRIDGILGTGAMGVVYGGTDLELGRRVALKIPLAPVGFEAELEQRLLEEARLAAQLRSDHVVSVYDVSRLASGAPFVTMELLEGESLEQLRVREGRLSIPEAVHHVLETCVALAEVHALGIVHRDVKPENLYLARVLDGTVRLKLLDFGISSFALREYAKERATPVGTPLYAAPEQLESSARADVRSDIWSLGAVLYELLTGAPPFDADTVAAVIFNTLTGEAAPLRERIADVPERLEAAVLRCLARDPEARFANVADLASELAPFGRPGDARFATLARRIQRVSAQRDDLRATLVPEAPAPTKMSMPLLLTRLSQPPTEERPPKRSRHRILKACAAVAAMLCCTLAPAGAVGGAINTVSAKLTARLETP